MTIEQWRRRQRRRRIAYAIISWAILLGSASAVVLVLWVLGIALLSR